MPTRSPSDRSPSDRPLPDAPLPDLPPSNGQLPDGQTPTLSPRSGSRSPRGPSSRSFSRQQAGQNAAFLRLLACTGNVRQSARDVGLGYSTIQHRRRHHPAFAQRWDAALVTAQARLGAGGTALATRRGAGDPYRTAGGEPVVVRVRAGTLQVRRAHPGRITKACEQAFLAALSATANVGLSAAAAGASEAAFYRRRARNPGFAREMRLALQMGYERLEMALLESTLVESHADDAWRHNAPPPIPPMTANQALQLLYLHQKEVVIGTPDPLRRRRGESSDVAALRLQLLAEQRDARAREDFRIAEALRRERGEPLMTDFLSDPPALPPFDQVTGWSKASGRPPHDDSRALFGGWRIGDIEGEGG